MAALELYRRKRGGRVSFHELNFSKLTYIFLNVVGPNGRVGIVL